MSARTLALTTVLLLSGCNQLLEIHPPADQTWTPDAATATGRQSAAPDEDAGGED